MRAKVTSGNSLSTYSKQEPPQNMPLPGTEMISKIANGLVVSVAYITGHIWGWGAKAYQGLVRAYWQSRYPGSL